MDRLYPLTRATVALGYAALLLVGCDNSSAEKEAAAPPARFQAVTKSTGVSEKDLAGFCDIRTNGGFHLPPTSGPNEPQGARWVNIWATWCKSCVEEMPMIERWKAAHGLKVLYVSADEETEALPAFQKLHPDFPETAVMTEPESLTGWMKEMGLDAGAGLPLHLFISNENKILCARAGAVAEHHLPVIKDLLK